MQLSPGTRLRGIACGTDVVVVRAPGRELEMTCCGAAMVDREEQSDDAAAPESSVEEETVLIGKRYSDVNNGLEVLCTREGAGPMMCDGRPLTVNAPRPLPSSD